MLLNAAGLRRSCSRTYWQCYGATDEFGLGAKEKPIHPHDPHATLLHEFGLDRQR